MVQLVKTPALHAGDRRFESFRPYSMSQDVYGSSVISDNMDAINFALSSRSMGKSRMMAQKAIPSMLLPDEAKIPVCNIGGHRIVPKEEGDGVTYSCIDCDWRAAHVTKNRSAEQCRNLEAYVYGDALHTDCEKKVDVVREINEEITVDV